MSSNRIKTILTGEKLVSAAMFDAGFFSKGLVSRAQFLDCLDNAPFETLKRILTETSFRPVKINDNLAFFYLWPKTLSVGASRCSITAVS